MKNTTHLPILYVWASATLGLTCLYQSHVMLATFAVTVAAICWRWRLEPKPTARFSSEEMESVAKAIENLSKEIGDGREETKSLKGQFSALQIKLGFQRPNAVGG